jgi:hypothetical protein
MHDQPTDATTKAALVVAALLTLVAVFLENGSVAWALAPIAFLLVMFAMSRVPLRQSLMGVMFFTLTLENQAESPAGGMYRSPLFNLGKLMLTHMNLTTGVTWMSISGMDVLLIFLMLLVWYRRVTRSTIDGHPVPVPEPMKKLAMLSLVGTTFVWLWGMATGGNFQKSLWQVEKVTYLPILFLLFASALRGTSDYVAVGRVFLTAAFVRASFAIYVMNFAGLKDLPPWATTHHDSMLFACSIVIIVSLLMHRAHKKALTIALLFGPIIVWGIIENNRRTAWVQVFLVFITLYFCTPDSPAKRKIKKFALYTSPLSLLYLGIGWRLGTGIFKPVGSIRSAIQPANDLSTMTRDIENYCVAKTIASSPIFGLGYGHRFFELVGLPAMPHPLEPWLPHNSLLGLWFAAGFVGYTAMSLLWTAGVYFGVRAYREAKNQMNKAIALVCFGSVLIYLIQCYADLGLGALTGVYMVAPSLAIAGQLAVMTGAWQAKDVPRQAATARSAPAGV